MSFDISVTRFEAERGEHVSSRLYVHNDGAEPLPPGRLIATAVVKKELTNIGFNIPAPIAPGATMMVEREMPIHYKPRQISFHSFQVAASATQPEKLTHPSRFTRGWGSGYSHRNDHILGRT